MAVAAKTAGEDSSQRPGHRLPFLGPQYTTLPKQNQSMRFIAQQACYGRKYASSEVKKHIFPL